MTANDPESDVLALTEAACAGDRAALDALIVRYLPQLRAFIRLRAGPVLRLHESSSDLVQSVCREVIQNADHFRHPSETAFRQWLYTTALRKIQQRDRYFLAQKRDLRQLEAPAASDSAGLDPLLALQYSSIASPSSAAGNKELIERVEAAFDELTEEQREVVTLAHLVGLSRAEIAERLGKSEGAVRVALYRALARIAELLDSPAGPPESPPSE